MAGPGAAHQGRADVLIIGAGASGLGRGAPPRARRFRRRLPRAGRLADPSEFPGDKPEWELLAPKQWHPNPNVRGRPADYPCDTSDSDVNPLMWRGVGGSTILYAAHWVRFLPSDFRVQIARRDRRRLALHLRGPGARTTRRWTRVRRLRARRRPRVPGRRGDRRCRRCRSARSAARRPTGMEQARLALVAGAERDPLARVPEPACVRAARHLPHRLPGAREGIDRPHPLAGRARARRPADHRRARARDHDDERGPRERRHLHRPQGHASATRQATSSSSAPTASARRGCCCCRGRAAFPTVSPTPRASSASA